VKKEAVAIRDVVSDIIRKLETGRGSQAGILSASWAEAIGEKNVKHAKPVDVKDGILIVHVDSSVWIHKLSMDKQDIIMKMKNRVGEGIVKDIKFRIGHLLY
jgi:predicted nucleic acid-binding Zn ribbon protein